MRKPSYEHFYGGRKPFRLVNHPNCRLYYHAQQLYPNLYVVGLRQTILSDPVSLDEALEFIKEAEAVPGQSRVMRNMCRVCTREARGMGWLFQCPCEVCGTDEVDAHHEDYRYPLRVRWLCKEHHRAEHKALDKRKKEAILSTR